mmetsp:Transcript_27632/g.60501  ORF Transcript_27632/g.60501 Transcript_27632/m.60501 type:complete len:2143 (+) Transcript_27632:192-6620(+)
MAQSVDNQSVNSSDAGRSETSSVRQANSHLRNRAKANEGAEGDLLEEKKSLEEALYSCMYALGKEQFFTSWQYSYLKVLLEGLVTFIIIFNPSCTYWNIDTDNWLWKIVRWPVFRSPISRLWGYEFYTKLYYVILAIIYAVLAAVGYLAWSLRKSDQGKWLKPFSKVVQLLSDLVFSVLYMTFFDYLVFVFDCRFGSGNMHVYFTDVNCMAMPHLALMALGGITCIVFMFSAGAMLVAACDLNPIARGLLASPTAWMRLKVLCAKTAIIIAADTLDSTYKVQTLLMTLSIFLTLWFVTRSLPYYRAYMNFIWCATLSAALYASIVYTITAWNSNRDDVDFRKEMTMKVLYGVFPIALGGALISFLYYKYKMLAIKKFTDPNADRTRLKKIYKFSSPEEVELLSRVMQKFDEDGVVDPDAANLGELIIKAGLATFPDAPYLLVLYANFHMSVRHDGPAGRIQLQLASKHSPGIIERYQIFSTIENSKRTKDNADSGTMDVHFYAEYKRNYRAVIRAHKDALLQQREFWRTLLHSRSKSSTVYKAMQDLDERVDRAHMVYKKVMERYPKNTKLLRCYGSFMENVRNDLKAAQRAYAEAMKHGSSGEGFLGMDFNFAGQAGKPEMLQSMNSSEDAVVIINAEGVIMMVSEGVSTLFGWAKSELEGQNVSILMPAPFNQRHQAFIQRYVATGTPNLLDQEREMVALHKERHVFPVTLCVTKLSGVGADCVFLGLLQPVPFSKNDVRVWVTSTGTVLCSGVFFTSLVGIPTEKVLGQSIRDFCSVPEEMDELLRQANETGSDVLDAGSLHVQISVVNKYVGLIPCTCRVQLGGSDQTRIYIMHFHRDDKTDDSVMVFDSHGSVNFATYDMGITLGYPLKKLLTLKLEQLLPPPINVLHRNWLRDPPLAVAPASCRAGAVVHMVTASGAQVPVKLQISQSEDASGVKYVAKITKPAVADLLSHQRVVLTTSADGTISSVEPESGSLFGFPSNLLKDCSICDVIDVFGEWREATGKDDVQLLLLALLDKEVEIPGSSWRVKVVCPEKEVAGAVTRLPDINAPRGRRASIMSTGKGFDKTSKVAVLQASMVEQVGENGEHKTVVQIALWRRDLMTGLVEVDDQLRVHKADAVSGLIMGTPHSAMLRTPLSKYLDLPDAPWDQVMGIVSRNQRGALKGASAATRIEVGQLKAYEGPHPDGGTMRILVQGCSHVDSSTGRTRISIMLKPDTTFVGARANLWVALGLNMHIGSGALSPLGIAGEAEGVRQRRKSDSSGTSRSSNDDVYEVEGGKVKRMSAELEEEEEGEGTQFTAAKGSKAFVEQWVQTISQRDKDGAAAPLAPGSMPNARKSARFSIEGGAQRPAEEQQDQERTSWPPLARGPSGAGQSKGKSDWRKLAQSLPDEAEGLAKRTGKAEGRPSAAAADGRDDDDGASSDGGSFTASKDHTTFTGLSAVTGRTHDEILIDAKRARVLRKLMVQLLGAKMTAPFARLKVQTFFVLALALLARIVCYLVMVALLQQEYTNIYQVHKTALATDRSQVVAVRAYQLEWCLRNNKTDYVCTLIGNLDAYNKDVSGLLDDMETNHHDVYLGLNGVPRQIEDEDTYATWANIPPLVNITLYLDSVPPVRTYLGIGVWEGGNRFIAAGRELLYLGKHIAGQIHKSRPFNFIMDNGYASLYKAYTGTLDLLVRYAWRKLGSLKHNLVVLMVIEALLMLPVCLLYQWYLIRDAEAVRRLHWLIMVGLPVPVLRALCSRPVKIDCDTDDESDDDDDDEGDVQQHAAKRPGGPTSEEATAQQKAVAGGQAPGPSIEGSGKQVVVEDSTVANPVRGMPPRKAAQGLAPSYKQTLIFLLPILLWNVAMLAIYGISIKSLDGMQDPLSALNMAMHVIYRFSHLRLGALMLAFAETDAAKDLWKAKLASQITDLQSDYDTLMYGGVSITQQDSVYQEAAPASAFESSTFSYNFFKSKECMRWDKSTCFDQSSEYYEVTHNGLDTMFRRVVSELTLMTQDNNTDIMYNSSRYNLMYRVGAADLYQGLQTSAQLYVDYSINRYAQVKAMFLILLLVLAFSEVAYVLLVLWPYLKEASAEALKVGGLLSHVPPEMDAAGHVRWYLSNHKHMHTQQEGGGAGADGAAGDDNMSEQGLLSPGEKRV